MAPAREVAGGRTVAYQMSACRAIEDACGITVPRPITDLRRLLYCGEWIGSHVLHIYFLHAPDFLGYPHQLGPGRPVASSHGVGLATAYRLSEVLGSRPERLVVVGVQVVDTGLGRGLSPAVAARLPGVLDRVLTELDLPTLWWRTHGPRLGAP